MSYRAVATTILFLASIIVGCEATTSTSQAASGASGSASPSGSATTKPKDANAADGAALFSKYCALCHGPEGNGYAADNAPSLVTQTFLESASDSFISNAIRVGRPGTAMAAYSKTRGGPLNEVEIRALTRFIRAKGPTLKSLAPATGEGNAENGAKVFQAQCVTCHGTEQARATAVWLFNPELLRSATPDFLRHAITHGRPPTPMLPFGPTLGAQSVEDLVAFLRSKAPLAPGVVPKVELDLLAKLPVIINPKGRRPTFTLRDNRYVSIVQVKKALEAKNRMIIIDARSPADFIQSHIPGAIPNGYYDKAGLDRLQNDGTWVIAYCACPHHASGEVVDELRRRGFKNTAVLDEGILEWQRQGFPIEGQSQTPVPAPPPLVPSLGAPAPTGSTTAVPPKAPAATTAPSATPTGR